MNTKSIWKSGIRECWEWVVINFLLPALIPIFFAFMCAFIVKDITPIRIIWILFEKGIFVFLGITMMLSLFQDYKIAPKIFKRHIYVILFVFIVASGFMFISSLGFIENGKSFSENSVVHLTTLILSIFIAIYVKIKILIYSFKNKNYGKL
jgi:hypothetical protein